MRVAGVIGGVRDLVMGTAAALRRRRQSRTPRLRVRVAHGEARVLPAGSEQSERIMALAAELVAASDTGRGNA